MKKLYLITLFLFLSLCGMAQNVAIFECISKVPSISKETIIAIRKTINSAIINAKGYSVVLQSSLDEVTDILFHSNSDALNELQMLEIGKNVKADKIIVSEITSIDNDQILFDIKMMDVKTMKVDGEYTKRADSDKLLDTVESLTKELIQSNKPRKYETDINVEEITKKILTTETSPEFIKLLTTETSPEFIWFTRVGYNNVFSDEEYYPGFNCSGGFHRLFNKLYLGAELEIASFSAPMPAFLVSSPIGWKIGNGKVKFDPHFGLFLGYDAGYEEFAIGINVGFGIWINRFNIDINFKQSCLPYEGYDDYYDDYYDNYPGVVELRLGIAFGR